MDLWNPLFIPFIVGLLSAVHCFSMCGGVAGALSLSVPLQARRHRPLFVLYLFLHNGGRLFSYGVAGALAGQFGSSVLALLPVGKGLATLQIIATVVLVATGLHLAGWFPQLSAMERLGSPLWRRLDAWGRRLIQSQTPLKALLFGMVWGGFPCSMVYSMLLWSASTADPWTGASAMLLFAAGTWPVALAAGLLTGQMVRLRRVPWMRRVAGVIILAMGLLGPLGLSGVWEPFSHTPVQQVQAKSGSQKSGIQFFPEPEYAPLAFSVPTSANAVCGSRSSTERPSWFDSLSDTDVAVGFDGKERP
ncbi:MAG: sulfite exporter TauE/SafE family protein [Magnetococcales bacterium]|nr:sulfite exporter TauE/SafE family protein [Magnetococcales bacterium]